MLELIHTVFTTLLMSAALGGGVDQQAPADEEPVSPGTGVDVGQMPRHMIAPRASQKPSPKTDTDPTDDAPPAALEDHAALTQPVASRRPFVIQPDSIACTASFPTAGRSP